jgi:signal transduction histidine kinase
LARRLYLSFLGVLFAVTVVTVAVNFATGIHGPFWFSRAGPRMAAHLAHTLARADDLQKGVEEIHEALGVDVAVIDGEGLIVAAAGAPIEPLPPPVMEHAQRGPTWLGPPRLIGAPLRGRPGALVAVRLPAAGGPRALVRPLLMLAVVLLVSFALVYPLSRSITRPLEKLTAAVAAYGRGDLSQRSGLGGLRDEVGKLARTFDEMADRIQTARKAEKELLANVSHELRTPLARIKVAMGMIDAPDEAVRKRLAVVDEEVDELDRLIADVLTTTRLDLAATPLRKVRLKAADMVEKSRERALALSPGLRLETRVDPVLEIEADEGLLGRALDNLLENARKYGNGSPVEMEARRDGTEAVFAVHDRGPGIAVDELERVFDPFFRGSNARGQSSGFGLGLALAKRVAETHGGTARAANAEGGGASIELRLPAA